jgi:hypothetical protein
MRILAAHSPRLATAAAMAAAATMAMAALLTGCGTVHPKPLGGGSLEEAQTFPYYRLYWVGRRFGSQPLAAVDGRQNYNSAIGDSVYYGDCVSGKGLLGGGGSCALPLQITTVVYRLHSNAPLGPQRNALLHGVPATIYDKGRSIELYSGRLAIDVFSDSPTRALLAASRLRPLNAPALPEGKLPPPVYCPGLSGPLDAQLRKALDALPGRPCQRAAAASRGRRPATI